MVRRLKADELKNLPPKVRSKCFMELNNVDADIGRRIKSNMRKLRELGKGVCASIAVDLPEQEEKEIPEGERAKRASLLEDEHSRDEVREMATDIMAASTTKLTHSIRLARARPSLKMRTISLRSAQTPPTPSSKFPWPRRSK